jgi:hypothetical protein
MLRLLVPSVLTDNMEKIFVTIRVRPLSKVEVTKGSPWKLGSNSITLYNPSGAPVPGQSYVFGTRFAPFPQSVVTSYVRVFNGCSHGRMVSVAQENVAYRLGPLFLQGTFGRMQLKPCLVFI